MEQTQSGNAKFARNKWKSAELTAGSTEKEKMAFKNVRNAHAKRATGENHANSYKKISWRQKCTSPKKTKKKQKVITISLIT